MRIPSGVTDQYVYFIAVDATDYATRETGLSSFTVYRSRNGGAAAAMTTPTINETDATNMPGVYELLLDEDMTIDAGDDSQEMAFHITHAGMAPVTRTIELYRPKITAGNTLGVASDGDISGNVDGAVAGVTAQVTANVTAISGDTVAADNLELDYDGTGYNKANSTIGTCTTNTDMRGTDSAALAANYTAARAGYLDNINGHTAQTGDNYARLGAPAGASVSADIAAVQTDTNAIETDTQDIQTRLPAALVGGRIDANMGAISTSATAADNLEASALGIVTGACEGTPTTTVIQTDLAESTDDHYIGRVVVFTSGAAAGQATDITDYTGSTGTITVTALTTAPSASDTFVIV